MDKNSLNSTSELPHTPWSEMISEHPVVLWISQNGRYLLGALLGVAMLFLLYNRFSGGQNGLIKDYFQAEADFNRFKTDSNPDEQKQSLKDLAAILKKLPDLQSKYDGSIAQLLLDRNETDQAQPFASRNLERTEKNHLSLFTEYAKTSLLISNGKYAIALQNTKSLIDNLKKAKLASPSNEEFSEALYILALLRSAYLEEKEGNNEAEKMAWLELKETLQSLKEQIVSNAALDSQTASLLTALDDREAPLDSYIEMRLNRLNH